MRSRPEPGAGRRGTAGDGVTLLRGALVDGVPVDVTVDSGTGTVSDVGPAGAAAPAPGEPVEELHGYLLLPAPAEPHAHLDKAFLAHRAPNRTGDLAGAVEAMLTVLPSVTPDDLRRRSRAAALDALAHGATAVRSHADVGVHAGLRHVEALIELRDDLRDVLTLQVVALAAAPLTGSEGTANARLLHAALAAGADAAGGCPHLDPDPAACVETVLDAAEAAGVPVDLHADETTDPASRDLDVLAAAVTRRAFRHGATAGHCVSLGQRSPRAAAATARAVAAAGVAVVALPQTNLYLQGRDRPSAAPRGLTAVRALLDAGVTVAAGGDNVQDPFNPLGRGDPLEAAALLVAAGHLQPAEAYRAVSDGARRAMGLAPVAVAAGCPADLLAVRAGSVAEALATLTPDRVVVRRGRVVARTRVTREWRQMTAV
ncbi:MAG: amidohydrolase family protein [Kineosporiaceae bacterium]